jgi:predicted ATPase
MLTSIHLQNFKGHRDTTVPLGRMTVLVGPNGAGKTRVLQGLHLLTRLAQGRFVPHLQRIRTSQARAEGASGNIGHKVFFDFHHVRDIPAHGVGEGTLVMLALLTALLSPTRPRLLLVDDISQSLHPEVQLQLVRRAARMRGALTAGQLWSLDPERHWVQGHDEVKGRLLPLFTAAPTPPSSPR